MNHEPTGPGWARVPLRMSEYGIKWHHEDRRLRVTAYSDEICINGLVRLTLDDINFVASAFGLECHTSKFGPQTACTLREST